MDRRGVGSRSNINHYDEQPIISSEDKTLIELFNYEGINMLDITNADAIVRGIKGVEYQILAEKNYLEPEITDLISPLQSDILSTNQINSLIQDIQTGVAPQSLTNHINEVANRTTDHVHQPCAIWLKQSSNRIPIDKCRLKIVIPCKSIIPLEILTFHYLYVGRFAKVTIKLINSSCEWFKIKMCRSGVTYIYFNSEQNFYIYLPIYENISGVLYYLLHTLFNTRMSKNKYVSDTNGCPLFENIVASFFINKTYIPNNVMEIISYGLEIPEKLFCGIEGPHLFIPFNTLVSLNQKFTIVFKNDPQIINKLKSFELAGYPFVIRSNKNLIEIQHQELVVTFSIIDSETFYDSCIYYEDGRLKLQNLTIKGLGHVYNYIESIHHFDKTEKQGLAEIFNLNNDDDLYTSIKAYLDTI